MRPSGAERIDREASAHGDRDVPARRSRRSRRAVRRAPVALIVLGILVLAPGAADAALTPESRLTHRGLGPIEIGMTERQAERAGGVALIGLSDGRATAPAGAGCTYLRPADRAIRAELMLSRGRVVRIDLVRRGIRTTRRLRVGDAESLVRSRFAGRLRISPAKFEPGGWALEVQPPSRVLRNRRIVFDTDGARVTGVRAGRLPEVRWVERCG